MTRKSFRALSEPVMADPARRAQVEEIERAMETVLALAKLQELPCETQPSPTTAGGSTPRVNEEDSLFLSTLRQGVEELGGRLEVTAVFPDRRVVLVG